VSGSPPLGNKWDGLGGRRLAEILCGISFFSWARIYVAAEVLFSIETLWILKLKW
jgi:hypothetical protein